MKRLVLLAAIYGLCVSNVGFAASPLKVDSLEGIQVNGSTQWLLIRTSDPSNPVLLYLHGGPGHSMIPFAHVATSFLTDRFTVVYWDQRGAGLSCPAANPPDTVNLKQLVDDTLAVTDYLKKRFGQRKIYLLGHSWGSELGMLVIQKHPDDFAAYVGVGQVISEKRIDVERLKWLNTEARPLLSLADKTAISRLKPGQPVSIGYVNKYGGSIHNITPERLQAIMDSSPYSPGTYTAALYDKGWQLSYGMYVNEIVTLDFSAQIKEIPIPVYFFLGRYDYVTPTAPVLDYFKTLKAPRKEIVWFEDSAHRMDVEEPEKFQQTLIEKLLGR